MDEFKLLVEKLHFDHLMDEKVHILKELKNTYPNIEKKYHIPKDKEDARIEEKLLWC